MAKTEAAAPTPTIPILITHVNSLSEACKDTKIYVNLKLYVVRCYVSSFYFINKR